MGKILGYGEITVANMTEPFTVMLTNEAQQFATDSNRKVTSAQSYYTDIIVIRGSQERTDYTIGNITSGSGITVSKSSKRVTFSVSAGATIGADTGVIEIPITLDGQTVKKQFSWSCGKQGPQGVKGENGSKGKSVQNVIEYYLATSASSDVTSSTNGWSTDPTTQKLTAEKKYLWNCKQTVYDDGTKGSITSPVICGTYGDKGIDGKNATYITVSGTNFDTVAGISKMASYISINGTKYDFMPTRGHTLVIINPSNGAVENIKSYDTYTTTSLLDTPLSEVESDKIICLFTADASGLTQTSRNTLNECGSNLSDIWTQARKTHVFIGMKGLQKGQAYEIVASGSNATKTVTAYYTNSGIVTNGANGQDGISPKVSLSKSGDTTTISIVDATGTHTQTVKDGTNGTPGAAGKDGKTSYFHVKYSNDGGKTFTGNSGEDTGIYMGSYTDYTEADSTDVKKYTWVKVKGDIGQKGDNAKNLSITPSSQYFKSTDGGKTFAPNTITIRPTIQGEISFGKWQYSIDGGVSFADVVSGQKGLTISNNVLTVSKDSSLYSDAVTMVTFRAVASDSGFYDTCSIAKIYDVSDIGDGRNLLTGVSSYTKDTPFEKTDSRADGWTMYQNIITSIELEAGKKYVLQAKTDGNWTANHDTNGQDPSKKLVTLWLCSDTTNDFFDMRQGYVVFTPTVTAKYKLRVNQYSNGTDAYTIHLWDIKLEKGSSPSGWTPAPEDVQTAILSTKSEISDVSLKVDKNKQAIEQRVEKTTYQQDLNLVKGDISKANEGLNKWRYEIYPKSLFTSEYQGKSTIDVFAKNTNLTPSQSVLINDTDLSVAWNYAENYIGYALTFAKFSAAKSVAITFAHDDGAHIYLNGKLIGGSDAYNKNGESLTLGFVKGWNCIEVVVNEDANTEGFKLGTTLSALSECQLMNCYYGTPVARQSHITNQLVQNTTDIDGISTKVSKVTSVIGDNGENFTSFKNEYSDFKQTMNEFEATVGQTYVTKDDFNGLEIGGRNLLLYSQTIRAHKDYYGVGWLTDEVETFNGCPVWSVKNQWGRLTWLFKSHVIDRGLVKVGDTLTYSLYAKTNNTSGKHIACSYRFKGNAQAYWFNGSAFNVGTNWARYSATFTVTKDMLATDTYMNEIGFEETVSMSGDDKVYFACPKLERGTKATDYTEAPEDNEINGQNLVSNLPSNWEQGTFDGGRAGVGGVYNTGKVDNSTRIRVKELVPVSGTITISNAYSNQSKKPIQHVINAFDVNKKYLGSGYINTDWNDFPKIVDMKDAKYIAVIVKYKDNSAITPSDISQICLKIERGTSATPFTLAPEDVNGKIVNVETIANQTAKKFEWIVKGGDSSSNFTLTDRVADLVADRINFNGLVKFSGLNTDLQNTINNKTNVSYLSLSSGGNNQACWKIATIKISGNYINQDIIIGVNHRDHGYTECRIQFKNAGNPDPGLASFRQTGRPSKCWRIIKTANSTWELYLYKTDSWDGGNVVKYINPYHTTDNVSVTWSGENADLPSGTTTTEQMIADQTTIDGGIITTGYISADRIAADSITADKIATDAIKSRNYISSGGTQGSFLNLSDGSFTSPNLSWDSNGNLIAKNANISGQITATKGSIAGWTIISDKMYTTGSGKYTGIGKYGSAYAFWAGATSNDNGNSAVFKVGHTGKLTAADVDITGKINATSGSIGNWNIVGSTLYTSPSNNPGVGLSSSYDRYLMWAGETNGANGSSDSNAKFKVSYDGTLRVGASSTAIELVSGKLNLYSSSTYGDRIGSIHTVHKVDTDEYMFGIYSNFKYGWGLYHEDPTNEYVIADMYTRPNNQGVYMPRGFNVSYTDSSGGGQDGYFRIARISITGQYLNCPIELEFIRRGDHSPTKVTIRFNNSDSISPGIAEFYYEGRSNMEIYACDGITIEDNSHTLADIYVRKAEAWDNITVTNVKNSWGYMNTGLDINTAVEFYSSKPNVTHQAENLFDSGWVNCSMGYGISAYNSGSNIRVRKKNGIVFLEGVATNSATWTEHNSIISFREDFAPARSCSFVMQGSGSNRWLLYVQPNGVCTASRYSNNKTMSNTVPKNSWLCMNASWIAK